MRSVSPARHQAVQTLSPLDVGWLVQAESAEQIDRRLFAWRATVKTGQRGRTQGLQLGTILARDRTIPRLLPLTNSSIIPILDLHSASTEATQTLLSSSMAEHPAVNRRVVGSSPT